jgi:hypothetical protein
MSSFQDGLMALIGILFTLYPYYYFITGLHRILDRNRHDLRHFWVNCWRMPSNSKSLYALFMIYDISHIFRTPPASSNVWKINPLPWRIYRHCKFLQQLSVSS